MLLSGFVLQGTFEIAGIVPRITLAFLHSVNIATPVHNSAVGTVLQQETCFTDVLKLHLVVFILEDYVVHFLYTTLHFCSV